MIVADEWAVPGYRYVRELGRGAAGRVVLAVDEASGVPVAMKYLGDRIRGEAGFLERFRAEARLLAGLDDPHLVRFFEYIETSHGAAIVMELVDGVTLGDILKSEGATGPEAALVVLKGSLLGLAAAHAVGVVHRDYKPGNVLVQANGASKLADFGIAVPIGQEIGASGTPAYMAPEQWSVGTASPASDVYAATGVFYECLVGERPYPVKELLALAAAHLTDPIPVSQVPEPLRRLVARGLAKDPGARPPTAQAFLDELEASALAGYGPGWEERGRLRLAAVAALLAFLYPMAEPIDVGSTALALTRLVRNRLAIASGVAMVGLFAGSGGAFLLTGSSHHVGTNAHAASTPTTSPPGSPHPGPSSTGDMTGDPTPTAPGSTPSPSWSVTPSVSSTAAPQPTMTFGNTHTPSQTPAPPPPPTKVTKLSIVSTSLSAGSVSATISVTISGSDAVTVDASFTGGSGRSLGSGSGEVSGAGTHEITITAQYRGCESAATVAASTSAGGSASGNASGNCIG